jgi:hypothetical protein
MAPAIMKLGNDFFLISKCHALLQVRIKPCDFPKCECEPLQKWASIS